MNSGSIQEAWSKKFDGRPEGDALVELMVEDAIEHVKILEDMNFDQIKISMKSFEVDVTINAYKELAQLVMYPFHIGITESGPPSTGIIRSSVGLGSLLWDGLRRHDARFAHHRPRGRGQGRERDSQGAGSQDRRSHDGFRARPADAAKIDLYGLADAVEDVMKGIKQPMKVAVMGCVVNGPGEAMDADLGIAGGKGRAVIFRHGEILQTVDEADMLPVLTDEIAKLEVAMAETAEVS